MSRPLTIRKPNADDSTNSINGWNSPCNPGNVVVPKSSCSTPLTVRSHQSPNSSKSIAIPSLPISASSPARPVGAEPTAQARSPAALVKAANRCHLAPGRPSTTTLGLPLGRWSLAKFARTSSASVSSPRSAASTCAGC